MEQISEQVGCHLYGEELGMTQALGNIDATQHEHTTRCHTMMVRVVLTQQMITDNPHNIDVVGDHLHECKEFHRLSSLLIQLILSSEEPFSGSCMQLTS